MKSGLKFFLLILLILGSGYSFTISCQVHEVSSPVSLDKAASKRKKINFTTEEKSWIKAHPKIKFTGDPNWLPFEAFTEQGKYIGITADYLKIIESLTGIKLIKIPTDSWAESVKLSENLDVDILSETTNANRKHLIFTHAFLENDLVIIMTNDNNYVENIQQIEDKKIAVIKYYGYVYPSRLSFLHKTFQKKQF